MKQVAVSIVLLLTPCVTYAQSGALEIWMRAFIPDPQHAGQAAGFVVAAPAGKPGSLVQLQDVNPQLPNLCFATDHRGFSSASQESARLSTRFTLSLSDTGSAAVTPSDRRTTAAVTTKVDCITAAPLDQKQGSVDRDHLGIPATADGTVQIIGQAEGRNSLTPLGELGPAIDYSFDIQWRPSSGSLTIATTYGAFPAFEIYARQPGNPWVRVVQHLPTGKPWKLGLDGFGINTERASVSVTVPNVTGKWTSADPEHRFSIELIGQVARWSERNPSGGVLTRNAQVTEMPDGALRIERANDDEVLRFLGFQPSLRGEILAKGPQPSFMTLSIRQGDLYGDWFGLLVVKDDKAHVKELVQPGTRPGKPFPFTKQK